MLEWIEILEIIDLLFLFMGVLLICVCECVCVFLKMLII